MIVALQKRTISAYQEPQIQIRLATFFKIKHIRMRTDQPGNFDCQRSSVTAGPLQLLLDNPIGDFYSFRMSEFL